MEGRQVWTPGTALGPGFVLARFIAICRTDAQRCATVWSRVIQRPTGPIHTAFCLLNMASFLLRVGNWAHQHRPLCARKRPTPNLQGWKLWRRSLVCINLITPGASRVSLPLVVAKSNSSDGISAGSIGAEDGRPSDQRREVFSDFKRFVSWLWGCVGKTSEYEVSSISSGPYTYQMKQSLKHLATCIQIILWFGTL